MSMQVGFPFALEDRVRVKVSGESGTICGASVHKDSPRQYLLRYMTALGTAGEQWFQEGELEMVPAKASNLDDHTHLGGAATGSDGQSASHTVDVSDSVKKMGEAATAAFASMLLGSTPLRGQPLGATVLVTVGDIIGSVAGPGFSASCQVYFPPETIMSGKAADALRRLHEALSIFDATEKSEGGAQAGAAIGKAMGFVPDDADEGLAKRPKSPGLKAGTRAEVYHSGSGRFYQARILADLGRGDLSNNWS